MNSTELGYYKSLIHKELDDLAWDESKSATIDRLIAMLQTLKRFSVGSDIEHFRKLYPELVFTEQPQYTLVRHSSYRLIRAEAIDYRNRLMADGLDVFRVLYADNGFVESVQESEESKVLDSLKVDYGADWIIYRIEVNDTYHMKSKRPPWLDEQTATQLARRIKDRWPWLWLVVYYGESNTQKVVLK